MSAAPEPDAEDYSAARRAAQAPFPDLPPERGEVAEGRWGAVPRAMRRWIWSILGIAALLYIAYLVRDIWLPLAIAFLIAMVLDPVVDRMERRGWSRLTATLLIFVAFIAGLGALLYFAIPPVMAQAGDLYGKVSQYIPFPGRQKAAEEAIAHALHRARIGGFAQTAVLRAAGQAGDTLARSGAWIADHAMAVASNLVWLVIIPIVTFYALKDFHLILAKSMLLVPRERRDFVQSMVSEVTTIFARFLRGLMLVSFLNGLATWLLLLILRTPNAFTLGAIAGVLYSVPYFGPLVTILLVAGVAFLHGGLSYTLLVVAANILLHQLLFDQVITPRILGGHVGLHPILSIIALLVGNLLLGIIGMLLAVPVAASIQLVVLTLVPKLSQEIDISTTLHNGAAEVKVREEETKEEHVERDATEELHGSVIQAVEAIEAKAADDQTAA